MVRHWQRFAEDVAVKPRFIEKLMAEMIDRIESALPNVAAELKGKISNQEELQMIEKVKNQIDHSVELVKSRVKS